VGREHPHVNKVFEKLVALPNNAERCKVSESYPCLLPIYQDDIIPGMMLTQAANLLFTIPAASLSATPLSGTVTYATMLPGSGLPSMATAAIERLEV
jgi:hypothetical protein